MIPLMMPISPNTMSGFGPVPGAAGTGAPGTGAPGAAGACPAPDPGPDAGVAVAVPTDPVGVTAGPLEATELAWVFVAAPPAAGPGPAPAAALAAVSAEASGPDDWTPVSGVDATPRVGSDEAVPPDRCSAPVNSRSLRVEPHPTATTTATKNATGNLRARQHAGPAFISTSSVPAGHGRPPRAA